MDCDLSIIIYDLLIVSHLYGFLHSGNLVLLGTRAVIADLRAQIQFLFLLVLVKYKHNPSVSRQL